jgi:hypothetical protein
MIVSGNVASAMMENGDSANAASIKGGVAIIHFSQFAGWDRTAIR